MDKLSIAVHNPTDLKTLRPVTGGVPLAEGAAPKGSCFVLKDGAGRQVPCQSQVIAKWKDGSARWVLLDFQSNPSAGGSADYALSWSPKPQTAAHKTPVQARGGRDFFLNSGDLKLLPAKDALVRIAGRLDIVFTATDSNGAEYRAAPEEVHVEAEGDLRSTICVKGSFRDEKGNRWFSFRMWASVYAGLSKVLLEPMVIMDAEKGLIQRIRELRLDIAPVGGVRSVAIGGGPGWSGKITRDVRLFQTDDQNCTVESRRGARAPGWAEVGDRNGSAAVALRDFWQQWPKSLEITPQRLSVGLFPRFAAGAFAHMEPWYKYDYLFEGDTYRLRTGQARRWQIWLDLAGDGESLAQHANAPLVPSADPAQAIASGVWGEISPAGAPGTGDYDELMDGLFASYRRALDESRDYGAMNWSDFHGERKCNWGNHEYDAVRQVMLQFARTGDPKYLYQGSAGARHTSEVDVIHFVNDDLRSYFLDEVCAHYPNKSITENFPIREGMMHAHCIGHVGGFHPVERVRQLFLDLAIEKIDLPYLYLCLDPYNLGHVFAQGMAYYYFVSGDPWVRETLERMGANLAQVVEDRKLVFTGRGCSGREIGWPMLALAAIYELDWNPRYLNAMRILAEDSLDSQDPESGGWIPLLFRGKLDPEATKRDGEATFIVCIRLNGMYRYYRLSGDERIPDSIKRGMRYINSVRWVEDKGEWHYTADPASSTGITPSVTMLAIAGVARLLDDPEDLKILRKAWEVLYRHYQAALERGGGCGKSFGSGLYGTAEAVSVLVTHAAPEGG